MLAQLFHEILKARVYPVVRHSPLDPAPTLSLEFKNQIFMKREDLQSIFSFKIRGAYNRVAAIKA
ncbi:MAG: threonine ammonia-lyase, biosynthetic, partial [Proteobacteria bacterium]|nr:threonine ammonia-lyase, biosynthetic [Pseudomonadota bacterium]